MSHGPELEILDEGRVRETLLSGDVDEIEDLFDVLWYWLPTRFASEVIDAVSRLDSEVFARRPRLLHLAVLAHHRRSAAGLDTQFARIVQDIGIQARQYAGRLAEFDNLSELQTAGTLAVIATRSEGAYRRAEQLGDWVDERAHTFYAERPLPWDPEQARSKPGWLSTQRGLTSMLSGDLDRAIHLYKRGYAEAGSAPTAHFAGANAAANLALIAALRGHFDVAQRWIGRMEAAGPLPGWVEHFTTLGAKLARAIIATEEAEPDLALDHLRVAGPATQQLELWPFIAYAWANYDAVFGEPYEGLARLKTARHAQGAQSVMDYGLVGEVLLRSEAKLLLRTHEASRVFNLARVSAGRFPAQYTAWAQLLAGHHHRAIRTAARALHQTSESVSLGDVITLHLTMAVAHLRAGHADRAAGAFQAAVRMRSSTAHVKPFLTATREEISTLADLAGLPDPLLAVRADVQANLSLDVTIVDLTPRELAVLHALDEGETAAATAAKFSVSVHTVRSQIASIYKKLGVSRRHAALARAHELGLLNTARRATDSAAN